MNEGGFGNCKGSRDWNRGNRLICYVYLPSTCTDLVDSTTNPGEKTSTEPCIEMPHLVKNISHESTYKNGKLSVIF